MEDFPILGDRTNNTSPTPLRIEYDGSTSFHKQSSQPWAMIARGESRADSSDQIKNTLVLKRASYHHDLSTDVQSTQEAIPREIRTNSYAETDSHVRSQQTSRFVDMFQTPKSNQPTQSYTTYAKTCLNPCHPDISLRNNASVVADSNGSVNPVMQTPTARLQENSGANMPRTPINTGLLTPNSQDRFPPKNVEILRRQNWRSTCLNPSSAESCRALMLATADMTAGERRMEELAASVSPHILKISDQVDSMKEAMKESYGPDIFRPFKPADVVLQDLGFLPHLTEFRRAVAPHYPGPYRGDPNVAANFSANIPDNENCALWIMGLPSDVNHKVLLAAIRNVGRIYAAVINPPTEDFSTAAAKLVFFSRPEAENMYSLVWSGRFVVNGKIVRQVRWNKIKSRRFRMEDRSRVIRITGPAHLMELEFFAIFFKTRFAYELDQVFETPSESPGIAHQFWYFGSLRCQAESAKKAIDNELCGIFEAEYVRDPCGPMPR